MKGLLADINIKSGKYTEIYLRNKFLASFISAFQKYIPSIETEGERVPLAEKTDKPAHRTTPKRVSRPLKPSSLPKPIGSRLGCLNSPLKTMAGSRRFSLGSPQTYRGVKKRIFDTHQKILNFNACGLSAHTLTELKRFLDLNNIGIICIQETKFNKKIIRNIPGYTLENKPFKNNNQNYYGGLATYFRHGVNFKNLKVKDARDQNGEIKIETQAFEIYSSDSPYILVNIYSRGCDLESLNNLSSLISAFSELKELVITGDFNSHHP